MTSMANLHSMPRNPRPSGAQPPSRRMLGIVCWTYFLASAGLLQYLHGERGIALPLAISVVASGVIVIAVFTVLLCQLTAAIDRIRSLEARRRRRHHTAGR
jgi:hypothetical protein